MYNWLLKFFSTDMAIDLGTANTLIYVKEKNLKQNYIIINQVEL